MILVDFVPGTHGHFLEFIINKYIAQTVGDRNIDLFTSTGSSHKPLLDEEYMKTAYAISGHYTSLSNTKPKNFSKVVYIKFDDKKYDYIRLVNSFYRCTGNLGADAPLDKVIELHRFLMNEHKTDIELRNNWYSKLKEHSGDFYQTELLPEYDVPVYNFKYSSFFNLVDFYNELNNIGEFIEFTFRPSSELTRLYYSFIEKNIGYQQYIKGKKILESIYAGCNWEFDSNWQLEAFLNYHISESHRLHDGTLFLDDYPTNTRDIYNILQKHLDEFDYLF